MIVTAVDPGQRWSAVVARDTSRGRDGLLGWRVWDASTMPDPGDGAAIAKAVCDLVAAIHARAVAKTDKDAFESCVSVEQVVAPSSHINGRRRFIDPAQLLVTASIMGAVQGRFDAVVVPPAGFGAPVAHRGVLLAAYPADLVGPREQTGSGKTTHQHARAAWDVAGATPAQIRLDRARRTA